MFVRIIFWGAFLYEIVMALASLVIPTVSETPDNLLDQLSKFNIFLNYKGETFYGLAAVFGGLATWSSANIKPQKWCFGGADGLNKFSILVSLISVALLIFSANMILLPSGIWPQQGDWALWRPDISGIALIIGFVLLSISAGFFKALKNS